MNVADLTCEEVNRELAKRRFGEFWPCHFGHTNSALDYDPCRNWQDAGELLEEMAEVRRYGEQWVARWHRGHGGRGPFAKLPQEAISRARLQMYEEAE